MCRLYAQLSPAPRSGVDLLVDAEFSLLRQADFDKKNPQEDGWGVAWLGPAGKLEVEKSPKPAYAEAGRFAEAARRGVSTGVIGHLRAASNPRGLPQEKIVNLDNTQPFTDGRWLFAHNGTLQIPAEVEGRLGKLRERLRSDNDSEVYFLQFLKFLDQSGDAAAAFEACVAENWSLWAACSSRYPDKKAPYSSLNAVVTDGKKLFAFCHSAALGLATCGVCNPSQPWQTMSLARRGGALVVASENLDSGPWTLFSPPEVLSAELDGGRVRMRQTRYEAELVDGRLKRRSVEEATLR